MFHYLTNTDQRELVLFGYVRQSRLLIPDDVLNLFYRFYGNDNICKLEIRLANNNQLTKLANNELLKPITFNINNIIFEVVIGTDIAFNNNNSDKNNINLHIITSTIPTHIQYIIAYCNLHCIETNQTYKTTPTIINNENVIIWTDINTNTTDINNIYNELHFTINLDILHIKHCSYAFPNHIFMTNNINIDFEINKSILEQYIPLHKPFYSNNTDNKLWCLRFNSDLYNEYDICLQLLCLPDMIGYITAKLHCIFTYGTINQEIIKQFTFSYNSDICSLIKLELREYHTQIKKPMFVNVFISICNVYDMKHNQILPHEW
eukprot:385518_1